ncbi:glycosyltransferase family 8 protein [Cohnella panacarvi]|uniref:glycosyltransferase family 8 protein n=1 Tax=Cohnella panacarvi TaxID=400776 RepID=UPI00047B6289|nr:glycosyltransferase family 8 protein [Cohnella panacarvi]
MIIATAANKAYSVQLRTMLKSLFVNLSQPDNVTVVVLETDIPASTQSEIHELANAFGATVKFIAMNNDEYRGYPLNAEMSHISHETFYRIALPELIPDRDKVIYMDCDILVLDDLREVWNIDLAEHPLAAVEDFLSVWDQSRLVVPEGTKYFNAGFLVINLKQWRENNVAAQIRDTLLNPQLSLEYMDQDAINLVLQNKFLELDRVWNYQSYFWRNGMTMQRPSLLHFTGPEKPWNSDTEFNGVYQYYLNLEV